MGSAGFYTIRCDENKDGMKRSDGQVNPAISNCHGDAGHNYHNVFAALPGPASLA
jgi:hypothetical protein